MAVGRKRQLWITSTSLDVHVLVDPFGGDAILISDHVLDGHPVRGRQDAQRTQVYRWEVTASGNGWLGEDLDLELSECRELVQYVWRDYHPTSEPPTVSDGRGTCYARAGRWNISLPHETRYPAMILHELAHSILPATSWHGSRFTRLQLELWVQYLRAPRDKLELVARYLGVAIGDPKHCRKPWRKPGPVLDEHKRYIGPPESGGTRGRAVR